MERKAGAAPWQDAIRRAAAAPGVINLGGGLPADAQFPRAELAAAFTRVLQAGAGRQALQYGWVEGQAQLRDRIAERLKARGARVSADDIVITNGAQQALSLATELLLPRGTKVGVEAATYPAALSLFRARRLTPVAISSGRATYVQTTLNNPTGTALSDEDYRSLKNRRSAVIEDDAYGDLIFVPGKRPPFLVAAPPRTYHVGTFSKTLCPGLRVGWLVVPRVARERARRLKETDDLQANSLAQAVVNDYLGHVDFDSRVEVLRRYYRGRAARLAEAIHRALPTWRFRFPEGGFCLWIETDAAVDERRFAELALEEGVSFDPGSDFQLGRAAGAPTTLRLCFSYVSPARFGVGARRLARAWRRAAVRAAAHSRTSRGPRRRSVGHPITGAAFGVLVRRLPRCRGPGPALRRWRAARARAWRRSGSNGRCRTQSPRPPSSR